MASAQQKDIEIIQRFGPFGNQSGEQFDDGEKNVAVLKMEIAHDDNMIYGIRSLFLDASNAEVWGPWHGNKEGQISQIAFLGGGHVGRFAGISNNDRSLGVIKSLTIDSMKIRYGPFGNPKVENTFDVPFEVDMTDYKVLGFFGTAHVSLSSIGVIAKKAA